MDFEVNGYKYEIVAVSKDNKHLKQEEEKIVFGITDFENQKIYINADVTNERFRKTIIHELTHTFIEVYGFSDRIFNDEEVCLFLEAHSEEILGITNKYFKNK